MTTAAAADARPDHMRRTGAHTPPTAGRLQPTAPRTGQRAAGVEPDTRAGRATRTGTRTPPTAARAGLRAAGVEPDARATRTGAHTPPTAARAGQRAAGVEPDTRAGRTTRTGAHTPPTAGRLQLAAPRPGLRAAGGEPA